MLQAQADACAWVGDTQIPAQADLLVPGCEKEEF